MTREHNKHKNLHLKQKAEELSRNKENLSPELYRKNLEELLENYQSYQFELEIQHEELIHLHAELEQSQKRFHTLFDHAPIGYCLLALSGKILQTNAAFRDMVGFPDSWIKGQSILTLIHPDDEKDFKLQLKAINNNTESQTSFFKISIPGKTIHAKLQIRVTSLSGNQQKVILCAVNDISGEVNYYKQLHLSEERFRSLVNAMNDVIFTINRDLKHSGVYGKWTIFGGKTPGDFLGKSAPEILGPELGQFHEAHFKEAFKGKHLTYEWSYITEKGRKYIQTSLSPIFDENNNVIEIVGAGRDISETKQSHHQLKERMKEQQCLYEISKTLQKTDQPLPDLLQKCAELIPNGFQYPEKAWAKIQVDEQIYFSHDVFDLCGPYMESSTTMDEGEKITVFVCYREDKEQSSSHLSFIKEEQNLLDAITENLEQAIEHIRARNELDRKNQILNHLNAEKDRLFSVIAHDLRSPFASIMGLTDLMEEEFDTLSTAELRQMTGAINKSTKSLFSLLENLLEWSRIQRGQTEINPRPYNASEMAKEAIETQYNTLYNKNITVQQNIPSEITVNIDKTSILSVFNNLLSNAIKFTPRGGSITISASTLPNKMTEFAVCDRGIGMSESMQNNLFNISADVKRAGTEDEPSSGLGLLISKEFVEMNGGKISVKSKEHEGSCFYFTVPAG